MKNKTPTNAATLNNLKDQGWEIYITHYRRPNKGMFDAKLVRDKDYRESLPKGKFAHVYWQEEISHFGGATELQLTRGEEKITVRADCYAKDRFSRRVGVKFALDKLKSLYNIG